MNHNVTVAGCTRWLGLCGVLFGLLHIFSAMSVFNIARDIPLNPQWIGILLLIWAFLFIVVGIAMMLGYPNGVVWGARLLLLYLIVETSRAVLLAQSDYDVGRMVFRVVTAAGVATIPLTYLANYHRQRRGSHHGEHTNGN